MKYTDEQIKKALECCINKRTMCKQCPLYSIDILNCNEKVAMAYALDLINRQEAEIDRLQRILDSYALQYGTAVDKDVLLKQAKSEAIKEFVERLKEKCTANHKTFDGFYLYEFSNEVIDNLVKEMVGEGE